MPSTLIINEQSHTVDVDPDMPLLWLLRDELGLKGTKFGCGVAQCGACTVQVDGLAVRSCVTPVGAVEGASISTIEASPTLVISALQQAWNELDVAQCGYCQTGQIMQAADLLTTTQKPSDQDIDAAMDGNVCRCATYARIRAGIHRAAKILEG